MKKLILLFVVLIVGCSGVKLFKVATTVSLAMKVKKQVVRVLDICKSECNKNKKYSDEWCDCMQLCSNNIDDERHSLVKIAKSTTGSKSTFSEKWMDGKGVFVAFENGTYKIMQESCPCSIDSSNQAVMRMLGNPIDTTGTSN